MKKLTSIGSVITLSALLMALSFGGITGCGSEEDDATGGGGNTNSGTSGDAVEGATSAVGSAGSSGASTGASGAAGLVVQALKARSFTALKAATVDIPESTESFSLPCDEGSVSGSLTIGGSVTVDDDTEELTAIDLDLDATTAFNGCTPTDIAETTNVDESDYTLDGTVSGTGSVSLDETSIAVMIAIDGELTVSGACEGTLAFDSAVSASGALDSEDIECTFSGSATGTVCGEDVDCTIAGDCENPTISGTGCE